MHPCNDWPMALNHDTRTAPSTPHLKCADLVYGSPLRSGSAAASCNCQHYPCVRITYRCCPNFPIYPDPMPGKAFSSRRLTQGNRSRAANLTCTRGAGQVHPDTGGCLTWRLALANCWDLEGIAIAIERSDVRLLASQDTANKRGAECTFSRPIESRHSASYFPVDPTEASDLIKIRTSKPDGIEHVGRRLNRLGSTRDWCIEVGKKLHAYAIRRVLADDRARDRVQNRSAT